MHLPRSKLLACARLPHNQYGRVCSGDTANSVLETPHFRARFAVEVVVLTRFLQRSQQSRILFNQLDSHGVSAALRLANVTGDGLVCELKSNTLSGRC